FRRDYAGYLARRMGPMIHALMVVALCSWLMGVVVRGLLGAGSAQLFWQLAPAAPLLLVIIAVRECREPLTLRMLTLLCVVLLEIGINLTGIDYHASSGHGPLPGLLLPVASSMIWFGRWDFLVAMALCALGPLPVLLHTGDGVQVLQYAVYMAVSLSLATVLRAFMARTMLEQFKLERLLRERAETDGLTGLWCATASSIWAATRCRKPIAGSSPYPCCFWMPTTSSGSTTSMAMPRATPPWWRWPHACAGRGGRVT